MTERIKLMIAIVLLLALSPFAWMIAESEDEDVW